MFKARDYIVLTFIVLIFSFGLMNLGLEFLSSEHTQLSDESETYIYSYVNTFNKNLNTTEIQENINNIEGENSNLTETQENYDFSREYIDTLKEKNKISFAFTLVKNLPSFVVLSLGLEISDYQVYIKIIGWFFIMALVIVGILIIKGVL